MKAQLKRMGKYYLSVFLYYSGLLALFSFLKRSFFAHKNFAILMYHRILDENDDEREYIQPGLFVSRRIFDKQVEFLSKKHNIISLAELVEHLKRNQSSHLKGIAITFDDGWSDNYQYAFPILRKFKAPATIFLTTDFIDTKKTFWFADISMILAKRKITADRLSGILKKVLANTEYLSLFRYLDSAGTGSDFIEPDKFINRLKRIDFKTIDNIIGKLIKECDFISAGRVANSQNLTWDEVIEMYRNGIAFGSHGCSHRILPGLTDTEIGVELVESKRIIEDKLGSEIDSFAYPNGDYDDRIKDFVKNGGYACAFTTRGGKERIFDIYSIKRINIHDGVSVGPAGDFSASMFSYYIFRNL
jgi:peptidoglycan/xylan/chitin deacetylase (PgdA/CDA1 family)